MTHSIWADFENVVIAAGTIVEVEDVPDPEAPKFKVWVDFGPFGECSSVAQLVGLYGKTELLGRQILGVMHFPDPTSSHCHPDFLLSGFATHAGFVLASVERPVPNGTRLT